MFDSMEEIKKKKDSKRDKPNKWRSFEIFIFIIVIVVSPSDLHQLVVIVNIFTSCKRIISYFTLNWKWHFPNDNLASKKFVSSTIVIKARFWYKFLAQGLPVTTSNTIGNRTSSIWYHENLKHKETWVIWHVIR